jgi:NAD(P)-dependent dehydrogenase (short-subunit alcohol dehydrogenase family)
MRLSAKKQQPSSRPKVSTFCACLGSLTQNGGPNYPAAATKLIGYSASKAALNMFTVQLAYELRDTLINVNSADPGYTATDLNGHRGHQTIPEGAAETICLSLLPNDGPTGTYSDRKGIVPGRVLWTLSFALPRCQTATPLTLHNGAALCVSRSYSKPLIDLLESRKARGSQQDRKTPARDFHPVSKGSLQA